MDFFHLFFFKKIIFIGFLITSYDVIARHCRRFALVSRSLSFTLLMSFLGSLPLYLYDVLFFILVTFWVLALIHPRVLSIFHSRWNELSITNMTICTLHWNFNTCSTLEVLIMGKKIATMLTTLVFSFC